MEIQQIIELVLAIIGLASIIVKFTPTQTDDKIVGQIQAFISKYLALNEDPEAQAKKRSGG